MIEPKIIGITAADGSDRIPTQAEMDETTKIHMPLMAAFEAIPPDHKWNALISLAASWCVGFPEPAEAFAFLGQQVAVALSRFEEQKEETRQ